MDRTLQIDKLLWLATLIVCLAVPSTAVAEDERSSLEEAYKKEFAYLESQKKALEDRLEELDDRQVDSVDEARGEVEQLESKLLRLRDENERLEETVAEVEREADSGDEGQASVSSTLEQANATLEPWDRQVEVPDDDDDQQEAAGAIDELFSTGAALVEEHHTVRSESGEFFGPEGEQLEGELILVGNIAAYGVSDSAARALVPAGEGRLKLSKEESAATARALAAGEDPDTLNMFLFESRDEAVEEREDKTAREVIESGGVIAWVIVAMGLVGALLVLIRALLLWRAGSNNRKLVAEAGRRVFSGDIDGAREVCAEASGAASRVLDHTLAHIDTERAEMEDVVDEAILRELPTLERFSAAILVFAAVAPLLGLLGTVTGMISTFDVITEFGTGDPKLLSGGISEALVTTQLGLIVAIPLLLLGNLLKGWSNGILDDMQRGALRLMNLARLRDAGQAGEGDGHLDSMPEDEDALDDYLEVL
ncbi:MAG: MotA/TolQ/ExbB proton channel family protein [Persicimonas sp.]